ncbi:universal stress protein [Halostella sp. JP-L12]|uniref:universal stress protein n=1 Tax=Halostella TaxID=1843185 RepID=UPI000EF837F0|nr:MULTISPECIES: universal stress protein [Halostella]NHN46976.1 universal stress protein [Halostella sp. JP-L12]
MTKDVLVAYDGSPQSESALEYALAEHADANLTVLTAIDPGEAGYGARAATPSYPEEWYERARETAEETLAEAEEHAEREGVSVETAVEVGGPANAIVEYAEEHDVDLIVTGSHGRSGMTRILLGSVAETVVRRSPVPVTVVR